MRQNLNAKTFVNDFEKNQKRRTKPSGSNIVAIEDKTLRSVMFVAS